MFKITYDNIEDLREKLNEIKNRDENIDIENMEDGSFKVNKTTADHSNRQEFIYKDGSISVYADYSKFPSSEEYKRSEVLFHHGGREYHREWNQGSENPWWDGEFKNGTIHGKLRWWRGADTIQKETIYSDGVFIKGYDYQGARCNIEYGRVDEFFETLRRSQIFNEDVEFKNSEPGPRRKLMGFVTKGVWHYICLNSFNKILDSMQAEVHLRGWNEINNA